MSEVIPSAPRLGDSEMIAKLINAGYLQPEQRNDPDAVTKAIARMKLDLRTGTAVTIHRPRDLVSATCRIEVSLQGEYDLSVE